jgi:antigen flippase
VKPISLGPNELNKPEKPDKQDRWIARPDPISFLWATARKDLTPSSHTFDSARNVTWTYFSSSATNFICLIFGAVSGIITARLLGPEARGELAILSYYPSLMASILTLGLPYALKYMISKNPEKELEIATVGFRLSLILGIMGAISFALFVPRTLADNSRHLASAVAITCLIAPAMVINPNLYAIHQGLFRFGWVNVMLILTAGGYVFLLLLLWSFKMVSPLQIAVAVLGLQTIIAFLNLWRFGFTKFRCRVSRQTYRLCLIHGLKFFAPTLLTTLFVVADRAILIRTTTLEEIGYYSVAFSLAFPLTLVIEVFAQVGFVEISSAKEKVTSSALALRRFQMAQVIVVIAALIVWAGIYPIIRFGFGAKFLPAMVVASLLVPAMALRGLTNTLDSSLKANGFAWPGAVASLLALFCLVGLAFWWVPTGGGQAFALALLSAQTVSMVVLLFATILLLSLPLSKIWGFRSNIVKALVQNVLSLAQFRKV